MKKKTNSNQLKGLVICDKLLNLILCMVYIVSYTRVITLHGNVTDQTVPSMNESLFPYNNVNSFKYHRYFRKRWV